MSDESKPFPQITPRSSVVLLGPHGSRRHTFASELEKREGHCEIDASTFFGDMNLSSKDAVRRIEEELAKERCRHGFALHHFPSSLSQEKEFEKMLHRKFGREHPFSNFKAVFLNRGDKVEPNPFVNRDTPEYDPLDPLHKDKIGRHYGLGTGNWAFDRPPLMEHFMKTKRHMTEIDPTKPQATEDIIRAVKEEAIE